MVKIKKLLRILCLKKTKPTYSSRICRDDIFLQLPIKEIVGGHLN